MGIIQEARGVFNGTPYEKEPFVMLPAHPWQSIQENAVPVFPASWPLFRNRESSRFNAIIWNAGAAGNNLRINNITSGFLSQDLSVTWQALLTAFVFPIIIAPGANYQIAMLMIPGMYIALDFSFVVAPDVLQLGYVWDF